MPDRINVMLAEDPDLAKPEYDARQVALYAAFAELTFKALNLPSVSQFLERLAKRLRIENAEIRILRLPAYRSRDFVVHGDGRRRLIRKRLYGRFVRESGLIDIFPDLSWHRRKSKPFRGTGIRGHFLNSKLRTVIHEMLHKSGLREEAKVRKLANEYNGKFREHFLKRFEKEFRPIFGEWKQMEKLLDLQ